MELFSIRIQRTFQLVSTKKYIFNLICIPICIRIAVKDIIYVLVTPSFYILNITAIVIVIGTLFFVILFFFHVVCFLILVQNYILTPNTLFVLRIILDFI